MTRRTLLHTVATAAGLASQRLHAAPLPIKKAVLLSMLPKDVSYAKRFQMAKDAGFEQVEAFTMPDEAEAKEVKQAAAQTGVRIHSVMNMGHWENPLSSADPAVVERSQQAIRTSLRNAKLWGADTVLVVPAVVSADTSYQQAWDRSQKNIRPLVPLAQELGVIIAIEEVWNKFLLSPLEFARYVDEFNSPWVKAYFDVGNVVLYGYPQDWIRTLGPRIVKLHIKDFSFRKRVADFTALRDGDIDWKAIHAALRDIGYRGSATVELSSGGPEYLAEVSRRFDMILRGD